jgi:hypothetical protein
MAKQVKIVQLSKYDSSENTVKFIKSEKVKNFRLLKREYLEKGNRTRRHYAVCIIIPDDKEAIGRKTIFVNASELINPEVFFASKKIIYFPNRIKSIPA